MVNRWKFSAEFLSMQRSLCSWYKCKIATSHALKYDMWSVRKGQNLTDEIILWATIVKQIQNLNYQNRGLQLHGKRIILAVQLHRQLGSSFWEHSLAPINLLIKTQSLSPRTI